VQHLKKVRVSLAVWGKIRCVMAENEHKHQGAIHPFMRMQQLPDMTGGAN
jgi:hypothetical protein